MNFPNSSEHARERAEQGLNHLGWLVCVRALPAI
jgi:hypothetical protein